MPHLLVHVVAVQLNVPIVIDGLHHLFEIEEVVTDCLDWDVLLLEVLGSLVDPAGRSALPPALVEVGRGLEGFNGKVGVTGGNVPLLLQILETI